MAASYEEIASDELGFGVETRIPRAAYEALSPAERAAMSAELVPILEAVMRIVEPRIQAHPAKEGRS